MEQYRDVVHGINLHRQKDIHYEGRDLTQGWDILTSPLPEKQFDMVWYHPPYWDIIRYSDDPKDLSNCDTMEEFEQKLNLSVERLMGALKPGGIMAILIGDKRKHGVYYPLMRTLLMNQKIGELKAIIIKIQHHCQSDKKEYGARNPFLIPIKHEYCLVYQKPIRSLKKLLTLWVCEPKPSSPGLIRRGFGNTQTPYRKSFGHRCDTKALSRGPLQVPKTTTRSPSNPPVNLMEVNENEIRETRRR